MLGRQMKVMLVVLAANSFLPLQNPNFVIVIRALFVAVAAGVYFAYNKIQAGVEAAREANAARRVWVKKVAAPSLGAMFGGGGGDAAAPEYEESTLHAYEKGLADKGQSGILGAVAMPMVMSMWMNIHISLLMAMVQMPWDFIESPLFRLYVKGEAAEPSPHGDAIAFEQPPAAPAAAGGATPAATPAVDAGSAPAPAPTPSTVTEEPAVPAGATAAARCEAAINATWDNETEPADPELWERLAGDGIATHATAGDKRTALMVVAGGRHQFRRSLEVLLRLGARPEAQDADGWTALHWAAYQNHGAAVEVIAQAIMAHDADAEGAARLIALLGLPDREKAQTALRLAESAGSKEAAAALRAASERAGAALAAAEAAAAESPAEERPAAAPAASASASGGKKEKAGTGKAAPAAETVAAPAAAAAETEVAAEAAPAPVAEPVEAAAPAAAAEEAPAVEAAAEPAPAEEAGEEAPSSGRRGVTRRGRRAEA